jgi:hypothetical protein
MSTTDSAQTATNANAQERLRALKTERAGYAARGLVERVKAVDEEIKRWTEIAKNAPDDPKAASEERATDEAFEAQKKIDALKLERAGYENRKGMEKRVEAVDEQIKHYTGVLRKAKTPSGTDGARPAAAAGQRTA